MDEVNIPLEQFFMGKWVPEDNIPLVSAKELHSFRPVRRSERVTKNATAKCSCSSCDSLPVSTQTKGQRGKKGEKQSVGSDKLRSSTRIKDRGSFNVTSQEVQRKLRSGGKTNRDVTEKVDKENTPVEISTGNITVSPSLSPQVVIKELSHNIINAYSKRRKLRNDKEQQSAVLANKDVVKKSNSLRKESKNRANSKTRNKKEISDRTSSNNRQQKTNANDAETPVNKMAVQKAKQVKKTTGEEGKKGNAKDTQKRKRKSLSYISDFDCGDDDDVSWTASNVKKRANLKDTKKKGTRSKPVKRRERNRSAEKATVSNKNQTVEQTKAAKVKQKRGANETKAQQRKMDSQKNKVQRSNKNIDKKNAKQSKAQPENTESSQSKESNKKHKVDDGLKNLVSHEEDLKPEGKYSSLPVV